MEKQSIKIVEVGPRDGLQNEPNILSAFVKTEFINWLSETGLKHIEVSSFVNPLKIPQLADADQVFKSIKRVAGVQYSALVPNEKGMHNALSADVDAVAVFTAVSEKFCQKNINCSIEESINRFKPVMELAKQHHIPVRAYVSCVLGCPYQGRIEARDVARVVEMLVALGCFEISLGDTIGAGTPKQARQMLHACKDVVAVEKLAVHYHDTRGQALANILTSLELGITTIDSSVAGLGGCPYAEGATGNVATEDVVYMLQGLGLETGVNLQKLIETGKFICNQIGRRNGSKVGVVGLPKGYDCNEKS